MQKPVVCNCAGTGGRRAGFILVRDGDGVAVMIVAVIVVVVIAIPVFLLTRCSGETYHAGLAVGTASLPFRQPRNDTVGVKGVATPRKQPDFFALLEVLDADGAGGAHGGLKKRCCCCCCCCCCC